MRNPGGEKQLQQNIRWVEKPGQVLLALQEALETHALLSKLYLHLKRALLF